MDIHNIHTMFAYSRQGSAYRIRNIMQFKIEKNPAPVIFHKIHGLPAVSRKEFQSNFIIMNNAFELAKPFFGCFERRSIERNNQTFLRRRGHQVPASVPRTMVIGFCRDH